MRGTYDAVVVGAGPAGIFAALELARASAARVLLLDKGPDLASRVAGSGTRGSGWGGAGAFSDGKLTLSPDVGGNLGRHLPRDDLRALIEEVDERYREFGAPADAFGGADEVAPLAAAAARRGFSLVASPIRHIGTERCPALLQRMREALPSRVEVRHEVEVARVEVAGGRAVGVTARDGTAHRAAHVVLAVGREGAGWLAGEARRLGLPTAVNPVDLGVRVEVPAAILEHLTRRLYEVKLHYTTPTFQDQVRTFCMCPFGEVIREQYDDLVTVNGHSYADRRTPNTNFALLARVAFTEPFHEPVVYGRSVARLANLLGGAILVQRLGDLRVGRRSTPARLRGNRVEPTLPEATPGDLSFALPYRFLLDILEMLEAMDRLVPGIGDASTLLYGIEVKFYSLALEVSPAMETAIGNLFAVGDGSGVSRGLVQSAASGVLAAREIVRRLGGPRRDPPHGAIAQRPEGALL